MDPLGVSDGVVDIDTLQRWSDTPVPEYQINDSSTPGTDTAATAAAAPSPPFTHKHHLNEKIILWSGNIAELNANAIVNSTNEGLTDKSPESKQIYLGAGPQLIDELRQTVKGCRTGEAKLTKGYSLPCRHVIHTVGPRYNVKYRTAAESALYSAYRNVLQILIENQLTSVALCAVNSSRRSYPVNDGTNIAIRTVRRFLEQYGKDISTIVFCVNGVDRDAYERVLPLYFPRSGAEARYSGLHFMGRELGEPLTGEPVVKDRQIRISHQPITTAHLLKTLREHGDGGGGGGEVEGEGEDDRYDLTAELGLPDGDRVGHTEFAQMQLDVDTQRGQHRTGAAPPTLDAHTLAEEHERRYERLLRRARVEDFSEVISRRAIYQCGEDRYGRPVIALVGHHLPTHSMHQLDRLILYSLHMLDNIVKEPWVLVYFHTLTHTSGGGSGGSHMEMSFIRTLFTVASNKYIRNLSAFYIVHPTFWTKVLMWYNVRFYLSPGMRDKVHRMPGLEQLFARLGSEDNFDIPTFIRQYDLQVNGSNYYTVPVEVSSEL